MISREGSIPSSETLIPQGWYESTVGDVGKIKSGSTPLRAKSDDYFLNGSIPWVKTMDLNNGEIVTTDEKITELALRETSCPLLEPGTVLVAMYGGFNQIGRTGLLTFRGTINQALSAIIVDEAQVLPKYLLYWLNSNVQKWRSFAASSRKDPNITRNDVSGFPIWIPPLPEQRQIAAILGTWDEAIRLTADLIAAKQQRKKGLMQRLLSGEVRFPGFEASSKRRKTRYFEMPMDWKLAPIGQIARQVNRRNTSQQALPVLSCMKHQGLVDSLEYFGRQIFSDDLSTYKIVERGQFAYATNHIEEGSIGYQHKYDEALISPMYTVFESTGDVDDRYLFRLLKTETYRKIFELSTNASVNRRGSLRWNEFSHIEVPLPTREEQRRIADVLETCDQELSLLQQKLAALQQQKKGLMQQLLTGRVRVKTTDDG